MATKIILQGNRKVLDSYPDMDIEFNVKSPVFEREIGSQTVSNTLPN
jgi:hypothetical protein